MLAQLDPGKEILPLSTAKGDEKRILEQENTKAKAHRFSLSRAAPWRPFFSKLDLL